MDRSNLSRASLSDDPNQNPMSDMDCTDIPDTKVAQDLKNEDKEVHGPEKADPEGSHTPSPMELAVTKSRQATPDLTTKASDPDAAPAPVKPTQDDEDETLTTIKAHCSPPIPAAGTHDPPSMEDSAETDQQAKKDDDADEYQPSTAIVKNSVSPLQEFAEDSEQREENTKEDEQGADKHLVSASGAQATPPSLEDSEEKDKQREKQDDATLIAGVQATLPSMEDSEETDKQGEKQDDATPIAGVKDTLASLEDSEGINKQREAQDEETFTADVKATPPPLETSEAKIKQKVEQQDANENANASTLPSSGKIRKRGRGPACAQATAGIGNPPEANEGLDDEQISSLFHHPPEVRKKYPRYFSRYSGHIHASLKGLLFARKVNGVLRHPDGILRSNIGGNWEMILRGHENPDQFDAKGQPLRFVRDTPDTPTRKGKKRFSTETEQSSSRPAKAARTGKSASPGVGSVSSSPFPTGLPTGLPANHPVESLPEGSPSIKQVVGHITSLNEQLCRAWTLLVELLSRTQLSPAPQHTSNKENKDQMDLDDEHDTHN